VTTLCSARDQATLQQLLGEPTTAAQPERCRALVRFGDWAIPIHPCSLVHEGRCTGFLLVLETMGTPDEATGGPRGESTASAAGCPVGAELCAGVPDGLRTHP